MQRLWYKLHLVTLAATAGRSVIEKATGLWRQIYSNNIAIIEEAEKQQQSETLEVEPNPNQIQVDLPVAADQ